MAQQARFKGFVQAVDALGGAPVCTKEPMRDKNSGIDLDPGRHHLDGAGALRYVRTRHSGHGDIDRVRRQQRLVAGIAGRHLAAGTLADPPRLDALAGEVARGLRPGPRTSVADMLALGWQAPHLRLRNVEFANRATGEHQPPVGPVGLGREVERGAGPRHVPAAGRRPHAGAGRRAGPARCFDWTGRAAPGDRMDWDSG